MGDTTLWLLKHDSTETTFPFTKVSIANQLANGYQLRVWAELAVPGRKNTEHLSVRIWCTYARCLYLCRLPASPPLHNAARGPVPIPVRKAHKYQGATSWLPSWQRYRRFSLKENLSIKLLHLKFHQLLLWKMTSRFWNVCRLRLSNTRQKQFYMTRFSGSVMTHVWGKKKKKLSQATKHQSELQAWGCCRVFCNPTHLQPIIAVNNLTVPWNNTPTGPARLGGMPAASQHDSARLPSHRGRTPLTCLQLWNAYGDGVPDPISSGFLPF